MTYVVSRDVSLARERNRIAESDAPVHDWYRFVLSFPPHLVRDYIVRFGLGAGQVVLDPFCGTGTTLVEAKKLGVCAVGVEAHPMAFFASRVKTSWEVDPTRLREAGEAAALLTLDTLGAEGIQDGLMEDSAIAVPLRQLEPPLEDLLLKDSISALPFHKAMTLLESIDRCAAPTYRPYLKLAWAKAVVFYASNLRFGPEVGVSGIKRDASVVEPWRDLVRRMCSDLCALQSTASTGGEVWLGDSRVVADHVPSGSVDAVITSPPYPNEKDYTRTTRLESVLLGFIRSREQLRELKRTFIRSNTRSVYADDTDDEWVADIPAVSAISKEIERRRLALGKTSGFERQYHRVAKLYFGGMARHLRELRRVLKPGARLAYVVGDQASYLQVMIRTGNLLAEIADKAGYKVGNVDLFRTRIATVTKAELREEVLVMTWPGGHDD